MDSFILNIALIGFLGIFAQWLGWRFNLPAIVLMTVAGLVFGQAGLAILNPEQEFGEFYRPLIALAVAIILFEGGLSLKFDEIKGTVSRGVARLVIPGVPVCWALGALAAHYIANLSWPIAVLFSGIMIVTGPTVIMPLLRQSKLSQRPGALLKWEGIINDPIGALLAVIVYEFITHHNQDFANWQVLASLFIGTILSIGWGFILGQGVAGSFRRGLVPEYLKPSVLLIGVLGGFVVANIFQEEAGLLAVTAMGITIANAKLPSINQLRHFKENIAVLFVSGVFVILTATLDRETLRHVFSLEVMAFVSVMLVVVRPVGIMLSTIGAGLNIQERVLISWIAPRGIVAVAVSSFFAVKLADQGYPEAERMITLAFAMVFFTVVLHGFTMAPLGKMLGLAASGRPGFLICGSSDWSVELAKKIRELNIPVTIADDSWRALRPARQALIPTYYGEILSEVTEHHLDLNKFGFVLAVGHNEAHNALIATDLAPEMNRASIYQLATRSHLRGAEEDERKALSFTLQGRRLMASRPTLEELLQKHYRGWFFQVTKITEAYPPEQYLEDIGEGEMVLLIRKDITLVASYDSPLKPEIGDTVLAYVPPEMKNKTAKTQEPEEPSEAVQEIEAKKQKVIEELPSRAV
ncbi:MAG: cation:proton antiporter [bacterium]